MLVSYFQNDVKENSQCYDKSFCLDAICRIGELSLIARKDGDLAIFLDVKYSSLRLWNICCDDPFLRKLLIFLDQDNYSIKNINEHIRNLYHDYIRHNQLTENGLLICKIYTEGLILILQGENPINLVKKLIQMLEAELPLENPYKNSDLTDSEGQIIF